MTVAIGLTGHAGAGKDSVADILVKEYNFTRYALADKMREALYKLNPVLEGSLRLADLVDREGWDRAKRRPFFGPEVRRLLQVFGSEIGRDMFGQGVWIDALDAEIPRHASRIVVTDIRFPNEADWIHDFYDGFVVKLQRPGVGPVNDHQSDKGLHPDHYDYLISNDGTLKDLHGQVDDMIYWLHRKGII